MENSQLLRMLQMLEVYHHTQCSKQMWQNLILRTTLKTTQISGNKRLACNKYTMVQDVHTPNELRVTNNLKTFLNFVRAYPQIKEGDAMYLAPSKRISLW